jgi:hypothetical protein
MKYVTLVLSILILNACGQEKKTNMKNSQDIYNLPNEIKKNEKEPMYKIQPISSDCSFEILVNDVPLYKFYEQINAGVGATVIPMNWNINKSGKQKITIKMFPGYNVETKEFNKNLGLNAGVKIIIEKEENGNEEEIFQFKTPFKDFDGKGGGGFLFADKNYYEETVYFDAEVPYEIKTLDNSENLFTTDPEKIKQLKLEVVAKYNDIRNLYMNGTKEELANINYKKEKRIAEQIYLTASEIKDRWDNDYQFRTDQNLEFFDLKPIEKYEMNFYANGKLVCLEKTNNKKSALWGGFKRKDKELVTTTYILLYLYRPKDSKDLVVY